MTMTLVKGQKVDVTKTNPGLSKVVVGLGWNVPHGMDLDASAFLLGGKSFVKRTLSFMVIHKGLKELWSIVETISKAEEQKITNKF